MNYVCPVCGSQSERPLLKLPSQPLYQHPVSPDSTVVNKWLDLDYRQCSSCFHAYQNAGIRAELSEVYEHHYYTPSPQGLRNPVRKTFLGLVEEMLGDGRLPQDATLLEIGCSSGEGLLDVSAIAPDMTLIGVEPSKAAVEAATSQGLTVLEGFLTANLVSDLDQAVDLIVARHVIEHVFDFEEFFGAMDELTGLGTQLILETPCLDAAAHTASLDPFHIEHVHVFSRHSLQRLAAAYGWHVAQCTVNDFNNMIVLLTRDAGTALPPFDFDLDAVERLSQRPDIWREFLGTVPKDLSLHIWGAGSAGQRCLGLLSHDPESILDGNPAKAGMTYAGSSVPIAYGPGEVERWITDGQDQAHAIVIASTFWSAIESDIEALGYRGWLGVLPLR